MASFLEKVVLITGASSGIGASTAVEFAKKGASLALLARRKDKLLEVADQCMTKGLSKDKILLVSGDVTKEEELFQCFHDTIQHYGTIKTLVNNAGYSARGLVEKTGLEDLDSMYQLHARAVFQLSQLAIPYLKLSRGSIVNVSSIASQKVVSGRFAYSMGKAAMDQITLHFASELAKDQVRVNSVAPGFVRTNTYLTAKAVSSEEEADQIYDQLKKVVPLGRCGTAEEVAKAIVYLASDDARYITGTSLVLDGGKLVTGSTLEPSSLSNCKQRKMAS